MFLNSAKKKIESENIAFSGASSTQAQGLQLWVLQHVAVLYEIAAGAPETAAPEGAASRGPGELERVRGGEEAKEKEGTQIQTALPLQALFGRYIFSYL